MAGTMLPWTRACGMALDVVGRPVDGRAVVVVVVTFGGDVHHAVVLA